MKRIEDTQIKDSADNPLYQQEKGFSQKDNRDLFFEAHLLQKAERFERHQRLGHLHALDGNKLANELRSLAAEIRAKTEKLYGIE